MTHYGFDPDRWAEHFKTDYTPERPGRTTAMMREAAAVAEAGGEVAVICHAPSFMRYLAGLVGAKQCRSPGMFKVGKGTIRVAHAAQVDRLRGLRFDRVLVDHFVYECGHFNGAKINTLRATLERPRRPARRYEPGDRVRVRDDAWAEPWRGLVGVIDQRSHAAGSDVWWWVHFETSGLAAIPEADLERAPAAPVRWTEPAAKEQACEPWRFAEANER